MPTATRAFREGEWDLFATSTQRLLEDALGEPLVGVYKLEHMYGFDWAAFDADHFAELDKRYRQIPGFIEGAGLPRWFGADESKAPHLWAGVEPPGLMVGGWLKLETFDTWHAAFLEATEGLPMRTDLP